MGAFRKVARTDRRKMAPFGHHRIGWQHQQGAQDARKEVPGVHPGQGADVTLCPAARHVGRGAHGAALPEPEPGRGDRPRPENLHRGTAHLPHRHGVRTAHGTGRRHHPPALPPVQPLCLTAGRTTPSVPRTHAKSGRTSPVRPDRFGCRSRGDQKRTFAPTEKRMP